MKLIVGLGNPGSEYHNTRHNVGFLAIDHLVAKFGGSSKKSNFNAWYWEISINGEKVIFCQPQTYMNLSGNAVVQLKQFYKIKIEDILIIYDDKDIEFNVLKLKASGSSAGHNGIKDLILKFGTENFQRLKLGIGKNEQIEMKNWVLSKFSKTELKQLETNVLEKVVQIMESYIIDKMDFAKLMSIYNAK